ncbi:MAG: LptF/LptG family permease, partial [Bacteroidia bacterium]|nr:LptF/LptG family permease [Bacteroidia bacterium]
QLLFYSFISNLPKAAPLAVLLSSIMTMGNLGERYEMAALKSSGLSLFQIMKPLIAFIFVLAIGVFLFSNYTMPYIQLKGGRLLWDVRQSKPAFSVKEGVYYSGLRDFRMKVDKKEKDGETVKGIYISDNSGGAGNSAQLMADSGTMKMSADKNSLLIKIYSGIQYRSIVNDEKSQKSRPFAKMNFREEEINIDLTELKMRNTAEELFKNNFQMLNLKQLDRSIDSFKTENRKLQRSVFTQVTKNFTIQSNVLNRRVDSLDQKYSSIRETLRKYNLVAKTVILDEALESARSADNYLSSMLSRDFEDNHSTMLQYVAEWHKKLTLPVACIVLFFVGAPLGAIVRKGGLGMPVVIATIMFLFYHVISVTFEKSFLEGSLDVSSGLWTPTYIFLPFGIWLTWMAARDSSVFDKASYGKTYVKIVDFAYAHLSGLFKRKKVKKEKAIENDKDENKKTEDYV